MKRIICFAVLICLAASMCTVSAYAEPASPAVTKEILATPNYFENFDSATDPILLTYAMKFIADQFTDPAAEAEMLAAYGDWHTEFYLKLNKDVRGVDGYLAGSVPEMMNYKWRKMGDEGNYNVLIYAGQELPVVEALTAGGVSFDWDSIYNGVKEFWCGVYLTDEFMAANPDLCVCLTLRLTPPAGVVADPINIVTRFGTGCDPVKPPVNPNPAPAPAAPAAPVVENVYCVPGTADNSEMALWGVMAMLLTGTAFFTRKRKTEN